MSKRAKEKGKQYDHEHFMHDGKGHMDHAGLSHHEEGEYYKAPHEHSHSDGKFEQLGD